MVQGFRFLVRTVLHSKHQIGCFTHYVWHDFGALCSNVCVFTADPEHSSPIFLDCCGLVRRCLRDLRKQFGFRIGPWNQAYMYDTLPITVATEEEMKPGDLVFISATYYNPKCESLHKLGVSEGVAFLQPVWNFIRGLHFIVFVVTCSAWEKCDFSKTLYICSVVLAQKAQHTICSQCE